MSRFVAPKPWVALRLVSSDLPQWNAWCCTWLLATAVLAACSDGSVVDAGTDAAPDLFVDCGAIDPERGGHLQYQYVWDGERGTTGCVPAGTTAQAWTHRVSPERPAQMINTRYAHEAATDVRYAGFPSQELLCGGNIVFENVELLDGAAGMLDPEGTPSNGFTPLVYVFFAYDLSPETGLCGDEIAIVRATSGSWTVLRGGSEAGDEIEIEARNVTFDPIAGHTLSFDRMYWHVLRAEAIVYD